ncbi:MAG: alpha/beta hydrolase [Thermoleophilia bacterium]|jgi:alpha/beta superfamily hydrolase
MTDLFLAGDHMLEGVFEEGGPGASWGGVVVAHPHPLYGGTMAQPVVYRVAQACRDKGLASLRFNFRGVGKSTGTYGGRDEYLDVQAALVYMQERLTEGYPAEERLAKGQLAEGYPAEGRAGRPSGPMPTLPRTGPSPVPDASLLPTPAMVPIGLAGYSFGSIMAALASGAPVRVQALALIAFPVNWRDQIPEAFECLRTYRGPILAVCGEKDDLAPPEPLERALSSMGLDFRMEVVLGEGHLFDESRVEVGRLVADFMAEELGLLGGC